MSGTTISSTTSATSQKVPTFAAKAGFVIPKNKLSGSLVPISRAKKVEDDETTKQAPRKTKWGLDLTQDAAVKRGRASAYQTRVDQIAQQLKSGVSVIGDSSGPTLASQNPHHELSGHQIGSQKAEELELEKREAIGEILKLNPSYKVPSDYKPLLKEARVPMPVKQYPGYNFVGLVFGPGVDNQMRLEKETGATIQVYGTKIEGGQKVEIKLSDGNEVHSSYEDLYVHISAETFEKVDAAVSVIELLITSVSGNLVAAASATSNSASGNDVQLTLGQDVGISDFGHASTVQVVPGPRLSLPHVQFQCPGQWLPPVPPSTALHPPSGFISAPSSSAPPVSNPSQMSTPTLRPSNMSSLFGPPPAPVVGFNPLPQNQALVSPKPQPPAQLPHHPYMAQTSRIPSLMAQLPSAQANNISAPLPSIGSQIQPRAITRPSMPLLPQSISSFPPGSLPGDASASICFSNMMQTALRMVPQVPQPSPLPSNVTAAVPVSPMNPRPASPSFLSVLRPQMGPPHSLSASISPAPVHAPVLGPPQTPLGSSSVSVSVANLAPVKPPLLTAPRPGNFTFQPHGPQNHASHAVPWGSNQFGTQNAPPANAMLQPPASQLPLSVFPRPQAGNMGQPQPHVSLVPFARNRTRILGPDLPTFLDASSILPRNQIPQMEPRNYTSTPQMPVLPGILPSRPGSDVPLRNFPVQMMRPETLLAQSHQVNGNPSNCGRSTSAHVEQQLYDPFSPTSLSITPRQQDGGIQRR